MSSVVLQPPLIGREGEIQSLKERLEGAFEGKGSVVLVRGEAGLGKTRLAEEFGKLAAKEGSQVMVGRCLPGAPTPFLPFQDALESYFAGKPVRRPGGVASRRQRMVESIKRASPEILEATPVVGNILKASAALYKEYHGFDLNPQSESERTLHAMLEFLRKFSSRQPVLMVLDDLQWADSASIQMVHFLARNSQGARVLVLGTYRPEELSVEEPQGHPLLESLRIMRREGVCLELELDPLNTDEVKLAIEGMLSAPIQEELLLRIVAEAGGNPLFAVETVRFLVETNSISLQNGVWKPTGQLRIDIPSTVKEVILRRIDRLGDRERRILDCAAAAGEWFDPSVVEEALRMDKLGLLEALDSITRKSQLIKSADGLYAFSHEKVRRIMYDEISAARRKELHRIIADVLERRLPDENLYGQLSAHLHIAEEVKRCVKYSLLAGESSLKRLAVKEALAYFQRALDLSEGDPSLSDERLVASEGLGDATLDWGLGGTLAIYQGSLKFSRNPKDTVRLLRKSAQVCQLSKVPEFLDQAESYGNIDRLETGRIKRIRAELAFASGGFGEARRFYSEARRVFEECNSEVDLGDIILSEARLDLAQGDVKDALEKVKMVEQIYSRYQSPWHEAWISLHLGHLYFNLGQAEAALKSYARPIEIGSKFGMHIWMQTSHVYRAAVNLLGYDFESVRSEAEKTLAYSPITRNFALHFFPTLLMAHAEIRLDRVAEAGKFLKQAQEMVQSSGTQDPTSLLPAFSDAVAWSGFFPPLPLMSAYLNLVQAEFLAANKEWAAGNEQFRKSIELFQGAVGSILFEAAARRFFGDSLLRQGLASEAREQFTKVSQLAGRLENEAMREAAVGALSGITQQFA